VCITVLNMLRKELFFWFLELHCICVFSHSIIVLLYNYQLVFYDDLHAILLTFRGQILTWFVSLESQNFAGIAWTFILLTRRRSGTNIWHAGPFASIF
jgi:hypothetical protein